MTRQLIALVVLLLSCGLVYADPPDNKPILASETCWAFGERPFQPDNIYKFTMKTCCWYHESTCCSWYTPRLGIELREMAQIANMDNMTAECYAAVADMWCNGCAPDTAKYVQWAKERVIVVTICPSTCSIFYDACKSFLKARKFIGSKQRFCEKFGDAQIFALDDDEDDDDEAMYRVGARDDDRCYYGHVGRGDLDKVKREIGVCLPKLRLANESRIPRMAGPPASPPADSTQPSPRPDWPFPLPPDSPPGPLGDGPTPLSAILRGVPPSERHSSQATTTIVSSSWLVLFGVLVAVAINFILL